MAPCHVHVSASRMANQLFSSLRALNSFGCVWQVCLALATENIGLANDLDPHVISVSIVLCPLLSFFLTHSLSLSLLSLSFSLSLRPPRSPLSLCAPSSLHLLFAPSLRVFLFSRGRDAMSACVVGGESSAQLKVMRQVATAAGLDMMMGVVTKTNEAMENMSNIERMYEAARYVPVPVSAPVPVSVAAVGASLKWVRGWCPVSVSPWRFVHAPIV